MNWQLYVYLQNVIRAKLLLTSMQIYSIWRSFGLLCEPRPCECQQVSMATANGKCLFANDSFDGRYILLPRIA